jgi:hypothetical protein
MDENDSDRWVRNECMCRHMRTSFGLFVYSHDYTY